MIYVGVEHQRARRYDATEDEEHCRSDFLGELDHVIGRNCKASQIFSDLLSLLHFLQVEWLFAQAETYKLWDFLANDLAVWYEFLIFRAERSLVNEEK